MKKYLFSEKGKFYRANLHCHTTLSDGNLTPEQIKKAYKERGYSIVAFTDHWVLVDHSDLSDSDFLALHGYELILNAKEPFCDGVATKKTYHLNLIAKSEGQRAQVCFNPDVIYGNSCALVPFVSYVGDIWDYSEYSTDAANRIIKEANKNGYLVNYNHPVWSKHDFRDYGTLEGLTGVEVANGTSIVHGYGDDNSVVYSQMLAQDKNLLPIAADDNHNDCSEYDDGCDSFVAFNMIKSESLSYRDVISAIERGDIYASTGPQIYEMYIENGTLFVSCSPVCYASIATLSRASSAILRKNGDTFTEFEFPLNEKREYFRIEIADAQGRRAYTRLYKYSENN